jgi:hypothetical protein
MRWRRAAERRNGTLGGDRTPTSAWAGVVESAQFIRENDQHVPDVALQSSLTEQRGGFHEQSRSGFRLAVHDLPGGIEQRADRRELLGADSARALELIEQSARDLERR